MELHPLLKRQIQKCPAITDDLLEFYDKYEKFIELVSESYYDFDEERAVMERSMDISSREYYEKLEEIKRLHASLLSSEKMASIGQLSAGIAHEINNPLGFIQSNIEILTKYIQRIREFHVKGVETLIAAQSATHEEGLRLTLELMELSKKGNLEAIYEDLPHMVDETQEGIQRISKIVRSLLNFSRKTADSGMTNFDLNKSLKDTLTIAYNEIKYYAKIEQHLGDIPLVRGNPDEINQVFLNIIMNAVSAIRT
ncbi:MAG: histidine kinase dimerization/phospho-acceptor domain-containing protein, partial [Eubacteriales bacterium]|nr:histidine kinase dimerization/phospho-acceptor domain-containing protein [Eubacteriales bacterium]